MLLNYLNPIYFLFFTTLTTIYGQDEDDLVVKKIANGSGIYYEPLSKLQTYTGTFNLLIHVNISIYLEKFRNVDELLNNNTKLCKTETHNISSICSNFLPTLHTTRVELNKRYDSLMSLQKSNRFKRGLINAIGNFEEWAFGSVGDESYQELRNTIQKNSDKTGKAVSIMRTQAKIVQSTINQVTNVSSTLSQNFFELQTQYNLIIKKINNKNNNILELEVNQSLINYLLNLNLLITEFSFETDELVDALTLARHNILHPTILNNNELRDNLEIIKNTFDSTKTLPININSTNSIEEFLKLTKISTKFANFQLIFILNFPICNKEEFILHRVWPMPIGISASQFVFIQPHNPYLAISLDKQKFISLTENDYANCNTLGLTKYFFLKNVVYFKTYPICEVQLFDSDNLMKLPEYCEVRHGYFNNAHFEKLLCSNCFVYWTTNKIVTTMVCPTTTKFYTLQGTGILKIPQDCTVYTPSTILTPLKETNRTVLTDYYPEFNLVNLDQITNKIKIIQSSNIPFNLSKLQMPNLRNLKESTNKLDYIVTEIEKENENNNTISNNVIHQYGIYICALILGYIIIHIMIKKLIWCYVGETNQEIMNSQRIRGRDRIV